MSNLFKELSKTHQQSVVPPVEIKNPILPPRLRPQTTVVSQQPAVSKLQPSLRKIDSNAPLDLLSDNYSLEPQNPNSVVDKININTGSENTQHTESKQINEVAIVPEESVMKEKQENSRMTDLNKFHEEAKKKNELLAQQYRIKISEIQEKFGDNTDAREKITELRVHYIRQYSANFSAAREKQRELLDYFRELSKKQNSTPPSEDSNDFFTRNLQTPLPLPTTQYFFFSLIVKDIWRY